MKIKDSNILLTGAGGGIGSSLLRQLINKGAHVIAVTRNPTKLKSFKEDAGYTDNQLSIVSADINSDEGRARITSKANTFAYKINILINCAGSNEFSSLSKMTDLNITEQFSTNLISPVLITKNLLPLLLKNKQAHIVNIGSSFDSIGYPGFSIYTASKFGLRGFTESLRRELADTNIKVTLVSPRATNTKMNNSTINQLNKELGNKSDESDYVAQQIINAIEASKNEVYLGWPERLFTKVNRIIPSIVDKALKKQLPIIQKYL
jgi:short-subunit dehydrogenase